MSSNADALLARTAALIDVASVSKDESRLASIVAAELAEIPGLETVQIGDNLIARSVGRGARRVLLAGHLDTVPAAGNDRAELDGDVLRGVGAADMKGGLAVMLALARLADARDLDTTYVFYAREEIARTESGLLEIERKDPTLLSCDTAIILEPTGAVVEAGCQGSLRIEITLRGIRAHSARPWTGDNAIHRAAPLVERIANVAEYRPVIDGCEYRESLQVVGISGGGIGNVVPDEVKLLVNYRFAPDKTSSEATKEIERRLGDLLDPAKGDRLEVLDAAPSAPPRLDDEVLLALVSGSGSEPRAKLGWTDVSFFTERAVPAANFGPGDPLLAHRADEFVTGAELSRAFQVLDTLLAGLS
ncbi:MAG TPA: succinyl-diaminopimelate desuccinylase [Acidimicrobiales bacterium]